MGSSASTSKSSGLFKQDIIMPCANCSSSLTIFNKKKCGLCSQNFCSKCLNAPFSFSRTSKICQKCSKLQSGKFSRNDLEAYSVKELRQFLNRSQVPLKNCCEKSDLVSLVLKTASCGGNSDDIEHRMHVQQLKEKMQQEIGSTSRPLHLTAENTTDFTDSHLNATSNEPQASIGPETLCDMLSVNPIQDAPPISDASDPNIPSLMVIPNQDLNSSLEEVSSNFQSISITNCTGAQQRSEGHEVHLDIQFKDPVKLEDITDSSQVERLNVRQMKELLTRNFVNYKGCCEKDELSKMVTSLWEEHSKNNLSNDVLDQCTTVDVCKICMDQVIDCVLLECGHMVACKKCSKQLAECPVCRKYVSRVVHVFRA